MIRRDHEHRCAFMKPGRTGTALKAAACLCAWLLVMAAQLHARDIDLDSIYISKKSPSLEKLHDLKINSYRSIKSILIDSGVIHSAWMHGNKILFIKEVNATTIVYIYDKNRHTKREIARITGTITGMRLCRNGRYLFVKQLKHGPSGMPESFRIYINTALGTTKIEPSSYPFIDFSVSPDGDSILYHSPGGIVEFYPESKIKKTVTPLTRYKKILSSHGVTIPFMSPNRKKMLIISGDGGEYRAVLIRGGRKNYLNGITSASELYWLDNDTLLFRKGNMGNYSARIYNVTTGRSTVIVSGSLNTNIRYSPIPKRVSLLINQVLHVYDVRTGKLENCGIEGEDASFSFDGQTFTVLLYGKLFMTRLDTVKKMGFILENSARKIITLYKSLLKQERHWLNTYTPVYLRKKIKSYQDMR